MESYLADLNAVLHRRNDIETFEVGITSDPTEAREGELVPRKENLFRLSLLIPKQSSEHAASRQLGLKWPPRWVQALANGPLAALGAELAERRGPRRHHYEPFGVGSTVGRIMDLRRPGIVVLHSIGGVDSREVINEATRRAIPVAYVHHFANERLSAPSVRAQLAHVPTVGGVSALAVPRYLRQRFHSLADGVDTEFFSPAHASRVQSLVDGPLVLLPARITPTKGQSELLQAVAQIRQSGVPVRLALAGREDDRSYSQSLRALAHSLGVSSSVQFLDELAPADLRNWYAASSLVALPTRHHEGFPRVLIEAQAMGVPVVAYGIGGVSEAIHDRYTGYIVPLGNTAELTERIRELACDSAVRNQMGRMGRARVCLNYDLNALGVRHEIMYSDAVTRARRSR